MYFIHEMPSMPLPTPHISKQKFAKLLAKFYDIFQVSRYLYLSMALLKYY